MTRIAGPPASAAEGAETTQSWRGIEAPGTLARRQAGTSAINSQKKIPVIDLFAGPGGLGEGFSAFGTRGHVPFDIRLSIEKDAAACDTLILRKFFRQFAVPPEEFTAYTSGDLSKAELFAAFPAEAERARSGTWKAELGKVNPSSVASRVKHALNGERNWLLLGGPPCQAYSVVGRSRMRSTRDDFDKDERHLLYREYLRIVAEHEPAVFVMENVKGMLTSTHEGSRIVSRILSDLGAPGDMSEFGRNRSLRYRLYSLGPQQASLPWMEESKSIGEEYLLHAERHGIPQMRHRVFIVGIRSDVPGRPDLLKYKDEVATRSVLSDLPAIRSALSKEKDSFANWCDAISAIKSQEWMNSPPKSELGLVATEVRRILKLLPGLKMDPGIHYTIFSGAPKALDGWYRVNAVGLTQHEARAHMREDLHRYLFAACYANVHGMSPKIRDFPEVLHPSHRNISQAVKGNMFDDRFRVQIADRPSTTITSHVAKDGHYYIHYDPSQCRSLTVREAARLQTFPDSYYFEGTRTEQYGQVGNAVPPLLARDIASIVFELLNSAGRSSSIASVSRKSRIAAG